MKTIARLLGLLWSLPNSLIGLLLAIPYGARGFSARDWALVATVKRAIGSPGAQTWGAVVYCVGPGNRRRVDESTKLWYHERHHVTQGMIGGVFFMLAYGLEWFGRLLFRPGSVPVEWLEPTYWERRGFDAENSARRAKRRGARWYRAYWNLSFERAARRKAGQRVCA